jgi:hypothetical protein
MKLLLLTLYISFFIHLNAQNDIDTTNKIFKDFKLALVTNDKDSIAKYFEMFYFKFHDDNKFDSTCYDLLLKNDNSAIQHIAGFCLNSKFKVTKINDFELCKYMLLKECRKLEEIMKKNKKSSDEYFMAFGDLCSLHYLIGSNLYIENKLEESRYYFLELKKFDFWEGLIPTYEDEQL